MRGLNLGRNLSLLLLALLGLPMLARAQGTAIGYQGRLHEGGLPARGLYDFRFSLFAVPEGGAALAGPLLQSAVPVTNGLFFVPLEFGPDRFNGEARWLEITVRAAGVGVPELLTPRTALLPTPYSIFAGKAAGLINGTVTADQLNTGGVPPAPGQFLSYNGNNFLWSDPDVQAGNVWSRNGADAYYNNGNVGIGTNSPEPGYRLHVHGGVRLATGGSGGTIRFGTPSGETGMTIIGNNRADLRFNGSMLSLLVGAGTGVPHSANGLAIDTSGNVAVGRDLLFGQRSGQMLNLFGTGYGIGIQSATLYSRSGGGFAWHLGGAHADPTYDAGGGTTLMTLDNTSGLSFGARLGQHLSLWTNPARRFGIGIQAGTIYTRTGGAPGDGFAWHKGGVHDDNLRHPGGGTTLMTLDEETGLVVNNKTTTRTLTITGGADVAEPFPMKEVTLEKGSVVVIDDEHPGRLMRSAHAYDTRVAGIVSGANGINPGLSLYQEGALEGGQNVALSGRVYVQADATHGSIKPGDLLTTSPTPGHAMKVSDPARSQGAVLGKAMGGLKEGRGLVLVLVTLQ